MHLTLRSELKKLLTAPAFRWGVLLVSALCTTACIYTDYSISKSYSFLEMLSGSMKPIRDTIPAGMVWRSGLDGQYARLFLPIATSLSYVPQLCTERESGLIRFSLIRQNRLRYALGKALSALLGGGLIVLLGFLLYGGLVYLLYPMNPEVDPELLGIMQDTWWKTLLGKFLLGVSMTAPSLLLCAFLRDRWLITCLPVLYYFVLDTAASLAFFSENQSYLRQIIDYFRPDGAAHLIVSFSWSRLFILLILWSISPILFCLRLRRKEDCGA